MAKKRTPKRKPNPGVRKAVAVFKGVQAELARQVGVEPPTVNQWLKGVRPVPPARAVAIERLTNVSRRELREDWAEVWPELIAHA